MLTSLRVPLISKPWITSEPRPQSRPTESTSAAPDQLSCGGDVNTAWSSTYSQRPANSCIAATRASITCVLPPLLMTDTASPTASEDALPISMQPPCRGSVGLTSAKPLSKS
jgi:hypothetical protein